MKLENKRERKIKEENVPNLQEHHFHLEKRAQTKDQSEGRMGVSVKNLPANEGDVGSMAESGRLPGE